VRRDYRPFKGKNPVREIAEILGLSKSTVGYYLKNYKLRGHCETANRSGRKSSLDNGEITFINKKVKPKISAPKLAVMLEEEGGTTVSSKTVSGKVG
jgi:transposase